MGIYDIYIYIWYLTEKSTPFVSIGVSSRHVKPLNLGSCLPQTCHNTNQIMKNVAALEAIFQCLIVFLSELHGIVPCLAKDTVRVTFLVAVSV